ncbi:hypothetical protein LL06_20120 [Hoeflea sp. BAL378]|uniref:hypothetical protein n=1 Tax=Hoeflea sp. BAL378 TaxID=1547437 RepID=UPI0005138F80|nr:hypothetical protein [Hoeflea sp. BAL378]KGF67805.1 hypothetical protein LL06_20120 [Hoeflea sp. BAL378]
MMKLFRRVSLSGRMVLALVLVLASIVPATLHAAALDGAGSSAGGHRHGVISASAAGHPSDHHTLGHGTAETDHGMDLGGGDDASDQCCPASCSFALTDIVAEEVDVLVPDNFELQPLLGLVVAALALPERPPRA